jgi:hypothetical protein
MDRRCKQDGGCGVSNLTGRQRYRKFLGKVVLQVEYKAMFSENFGRYVECESRLFWRDATMDDMLAGITPLAAPTLVGAA